MATAQKRDHSNSIRDQKVETPKRKENEDPQIISTPKVVNKQSKEEVEKENMEEGEEKDKEEDKEEETILDSGLIVDENDFQMSQDLAIKKGEIVSLGINKKGIFLQVKNLFF